ncbi:helicase-related protein [Corynebacterium sp. USCH3]|uniref:helicase-related protein n=1 Tax=Corynebacterium sp. USCH3 TaxID=3024840 RepID=UPI00309FB5FE
MNVDRSDVDVSSEPLSVDDLRPGQKLLGLSDHAVDIVQVTPTADGAILVFRHPRGDIDEAVLFSDDLAGLSLANPHNAALFTGDAEQFRLAAEALRIQTAGLHDPMLAVTSSDIQPLPHQIRAVYEEMLPRIPLHFLLADDPGAGKTIMAGLYIKELMLRGDVDRCLIVCPGGLAPQWQEELREKFGMHFHILSPGAMENSRSGNPFKDHDLLIVRMDAVARSDDELLPLLRATEWDLTIVDEAHRMSASSGFRKELKKTRRFQLGESLRDISRSVLLMTATPHNGDNEAFQAFLSLLDPDRFEGAFQTGSDAGTVDTSGLMRRMVKEELLTFDGRPLFPERVAVTVPYQLSPAENRLYRDVTQYVRTEMKRAERSLNSAASRAVGFALTVLQRRLASSPNAIHNSLRRRLDKLESFRTEMAQASEEGRDLLWTGRSFVDSAVNNAVSVMADAVTEDLDVAAGDIEDAEDTIVISPATAAQSLPELDREIVELRHLVSTAHTVVLSGEDRKWSELRRIIEKETLTNSTTGERRKLIIFTEHRDTLNYLVSRIRNTTGSEVVAIHGGTNRLDRQRIKANFTNDDRVQYLVATDAAGEGLNLQAAYLMVNYDLPWNPNRIEQRFGRIHRIGQRHVCQLWNLVADETREGAVYKRLLEKMETQRAALGTQVFDVLGEAFRDKSLRDLIMDAVLYIDDPARQEEIDRIIDSEVAHGLDDLMEERALAAETFSRRDLEQLRDAMDAARARKLQPHYIAQFFRRALEHQGGRYVPKAKGTAAVRRIPRTVHDWARSNGLAVADRYDLVTFEPEIADDRDRTELISPGHPLFDGLVDITASQLQETLETGAVLVDPNDEGTTPWLLAAVMLEIKDGAGTAQHREFAYVRLNPDLSVEDAGMAPYLDFDPLPGEVSAEHAVRAATEANDWLTDDPSATVRQEVTATRVRQTLSETRARILPELDREQELVTRRLTAQMDYHATKAAAAQEQQDAYDVGDAKKPPPQSHSALMNQVRALDTRLRQRTDDITRRRHLRPNPPVVAARALIVPRGLLRLIGGADADEVAQHAKDTEEVDRRAVDAVLAAERQLGRIPREMPHNNPGFDVSSREPESVDPSVIIEVKGRILGAGDFTITHREVVTGKNTEKDHRLALVEVSPDGPEHDRVRYLADFFRNMTAFDDSFPVTKYTLNWKKTWEQGGDPM